MKEDRLNSCEIASPYLLIHAHSHSSVGPLHRTWLVAHACKACCLVHVTKATLAQQVALVPVVGGCLHVRQAEDLGCWSTPEGATWGGVNQRVKWDDEHIRRAAARGVDGRSLYETMGTAK